MSKRRVVLVCFTESRSSMPAQNKFYSYFTEEQFENGDHAVVMVGDELKIVKIVSTEGLSQHAISKASKWIVQRIDLKAYHEREERGRIVQEIRNQLQERMREQQEFAIYAQFAKTDPVIGELLSRLASVAPDLVPALPNSDTKE